MIHKFTNRLINETSPYLLQHAHNPVDWYPWGDEAIQVSRQEDKPIFLSIGYSSCHWCHVMERESFEDEEIARIMNSNFISIKVDREERPDIDSIYMDFVQMTTGSGGWPLNVFLTPDLLPFFGGTYFPPQSFHGRPSFKSVLNRVTDFYRDKKNEIVKNRDKIIAGLQSMTSRNSEARRPDDKVLREAANQLLRSSDLKYGGFGNAPKFPSSMALSFLLRHFRRTGSSSCLEVVIKSLDHMANGGIYDHLGGGFHRYSTDESWLVPHFEKMLYDNALLVRTYLEAYQATGNPHYREVVEETLRYVQRDLSDSEGGFYSAEDADSEGIEGKFYVWDQPELQELLGKKSARIFSDHYDVSQSGNWEGHNILHRRRDLKTHASELGWKEPRLKRVLDSARSLLFKRRTFRIRPGMDDKVLAAWNGLMLTAFVEAAFVLDNDSFLESALKNAEFIASRLIDHGRIWRSWKNGKAKIPGFLDDYTFVVEGFSRLFQTTGDFKWLQLAVDLTENQILQFWDEKKGDFFFSSDLHDDLLIRQTEYLDNAIPSGNSTAAGNLLQLAILTGEKKYRELSERMLSSMTESSIRHPLAYSNWLSVIDFSIGPVYEIVVLGTDRASLLVPVREQFLPNRIMILPETLSGKEIKLPLLEGREIPKSGAIAYLCKEFVCRQPTQDIETFRKQLQQGFN